MNEALISEVFLKIINMSISASWLVLAVVLIRLVLKKAPKWISVLLWGFVAIRLICPFSIESVLSLIPSAETVSPDIMMDWTPEISTGIGSVDTVINPIITQTFAPDPAASANPLQILIPVAGMAWLAGIAVMLIYTAISYFLLRRKVATAVLLRKNIYQSENVASPFVLGIIKPKIYLPFRMEGQNLEHVIAHEASHIQRKDHWWKPFGFVLLALHWFNPLMWLAYVLLCRDIELACDEKVIKEMDNENRADYTQALVACSVNRRSISACPLAFGEVGVKKRVKSVMNYKKPAFRIIAVAVITCIAVAVCFLTNPSKEDQTLSLEDVIAFSEKGDGLTWSDFDQYKYYETGSGLYIRVYPIDEVFELWVGGTDPDRAVDPMYIDLTLVNDTNVRTDIRDGGAAEFIYRYSFYMPVVENSPDEAEGKRTTPITILSNGETITPYVHFAYSGSWDGTHFLCGDGIYVGSALPQLASDGLIPQGEYSGDFQVVLGENASISDVLVFDENFNSLDTIWDISQLSMLEAGNYYVGIVVCIEGDYIEEVKLNEYTGKVCVFRLSVKPDAADVPTEEAFDIRVSYANWGDLNEIYAKALNRKMMMQSAVMHLPICKFDTLTELERFKRDIQDTLAIDQSYDEVPSFKEVTAQYDETFFEENTLMLVYVEAGSGSLRYGVNSIYHADGIFCIHVEQTNNPEVITEDMAGWFITVAVPDGMVADCTVFDADMNGFAWYQ